MAGIDLDQVGNGRLSQAVAETLRELDLDPRDQAIALLAASYAARLDAAAGASRAADAVLKACREAEDDFFAEEVAALKLKLSEQVALKDLGARLEAALAALGATPASRAKNAAPAKPGGSRLHAFRSVS